MNSSLHVYQVCLRKDLRGVDLISDALPFGRLWYDGSNAVGNAIGYAQHYSRSEGAVIRVYDKAGNVIETRERFQGVVRIAKQLGRFRGDPAPKRGLAVLQCFNSNCLYAAGNRLQVVA